MPSGPPEADGEAEVQRAHVVPVPHGDEEHVSGLQHAVQVRSLGEVREAAQVWILHLHLRGDRRTLEELRLSGLSLWTVDPPGWCCGGAGTGAGTACRPPLGSTDGCICFPPPDVCTRGESHVCKQTAMEAEIWALFIHKAPLFSSPEPGSCAEGPGAEEKRCLRARTTRLQ